MVPEKRPKLKAMLLAGMIGWTHIYMAIMERSVSEALESSFLIYSGSLPMNPKVTRIVVVFAVVRIHSSQQRLALHQ
jgi:hypothetical protein